MLEENQVYEALGVGRDDLGTPTTDNSDVGDDAHIVPQDEPTDAGTAGKSDNPVGADGYPPEETIPPEQTPEQRAENAAKRRREEQETAINAAVQAEREKAAKEMETFFAAAQLKNTLTGEPITDMAQFNGWRKAYEAAKLQSDLEAGKLTPDGLNRAISDNPVVKQMEELTRRDAEEQTRRQKAQMEAQIADELAEINKLDPTIKTIEDIMNSPAGKAFYEAVHRGNSFIDAFYLANRERFFVPSNGASGMPRPTAGVSACCSQAVKNARGKDHLTAGTVPRGKGAVSVPADEMALFREMNPNATDAEIQTYYNKNVCA